MTFIIFFLSSLKESDIKKNPTSLLHCFKDLKKNKMATFGEMRKIRNGPGGILLCLPVCMFLQYNTFFCNKNMFFL